MVLQQKKSAVHTVSQRKSSFKVTKFDLKEKPIFKISSYNFNRQQSEDMTKKVINNSSVSQKKNGGLPIDWEIASFAKVVSIIPDGGRRLKKKSYLESGKIPIIDQGQQYIGGFTDDEDMAFKGELPVVLFGDHTKSIKFVERPFAVGADGIKILKPSSCYDIKFFFYLLSSLQIPDRGYSRHFQFLKKFDLPIAPLNEQKRIVAEIEKQFSRLDEAVENLKRVKANLKRYKAYVLKAAVEGKLTEEWRKKHPDVEPAQKLLERILAERRKKWEEAELAKMKSKGKESNDDKWKKKYKEPSQVDESLLPALPNGWTWASLPQLGELNRGKSKHRPRNAPFLYGGPYPFVQTGDIRHATGIIKQYTQTYSEEGLKQSRLWPKGTLCITIAANIADTSLLGFDACFPDSIVGFIPENENIDVRFIEYFIRTAKENLERYAPATAQKNINLAILSDVAVPLPPKEEQYIIIDAIDKCLTIAEGVEFDLEQNIQRADRLRQSILAKAFIGKLLKNCN